jgi:hypothetical protein
VLVECGFLTNPTEAAYAQTASYRQKLAEEIAAGVRGPQFRHERVDDDASGHERNHSVATVHRSNQSGEI